MKINADFTQRVVLHTPEMTWSETRMKGVKRRMLDRIGKESGRATSIVHYDPNSKFAAHVHSGGEEFIVLDGVFQDEHGDFPTGSYVRNPPQSSHTPSSDEGCMIFVKLWQFNPEDRAHVNIKFNEASPEPSNTISGLSVTPLYKDEYEEVRIQQWDADSDIEINDAGGIEILVLDGDLQEGGDQLNKLSWLRLPRNTALKAKAGNNGAKIWVKSGHLEAMDNGLLTAYN